MTEKSTTEVAVISKNPYNFNPSGKGGFGDHPELRNNGGRPNSIESPTYWMRLFLSMTVDEFKKWHELTKDSQRSVASALAFARVLNARRDLAEFKEVMDRTEGKSIQFVDHSTKGEKLGETDAEVAKGLLSLYDKVMTDATPHSDSGNQEGS